jgi:hypothetical protein
MIRLVTDENFQGAIVRGVLTARPDADLVRAQDTEMSGASDPELLAWAATQGRVILTHDVNTLIGFAYARVKAALPMSGVFVVNRGEPIGKVIEDILLLIECSSAGEWEGQVGFLPL